MTFLEFIRYKRIESLFVLMTFICSIITFYESVTSPFKVSSILYLISSILSACSGVYSIIYYKNKYEKK